MELWIAWGKEDKEEKDRQDGINEGCRKETGSWLQRQREGKRKEQSVRSNEDDAGGRTGNRDEERVQRTFSGGLHAAGDVDGVAKETVPRHRDSDHAADHRSAVQAAADRQFAIRTMRDLQYSVYALCTILEGYGDKLTKWQIDDFAKTTSKFRA